MEQNWMQENTNRVMVNLRKFATTIYWLSFIGISVYGYTQYLTWDNQNKKVWAKANCPALLSIGRSARDTLITMKSIDQCNKFVLENLR